jgi:hypothetical protein
MPAIAGVSVVKLTMAIAIVLLAVVFRVLMLHPRKSNQRPEARCQSMEDSLPTAELLFIATRVVFEAVEVFRSQ